MTHPSRATLPEIRTRGESNRGPARTTRSPPIPQGRLQSQTSSDAVRKRLQPTCSLTRILSLPAMPRGTHFLPVEGLHTDAYYCTLAGSPRALRASSTTLGHLRPKVSSLKPPSESPSRQPPQHGRHQGQDRLPQRRCPISGAYEGVDSEV